MATAAEVENRFVEYMEQAQQKHILIEETGGGDLVMMSYSQFERLQRSEDYLWAMAAQEAEKSGYIGTEESMKLLMRYENT